MTSAAEQTPEPDDWGILASWTDAHDKPQTVSAETIALLREVIGQPPEDIEAWAPIVTRPGRSLGLGTVDVECEDGERRQVDDRLPDDFPLGYHTMHTSAGVERRLIVSPGRCWLPKGSRAWGWTAQLYAVRSQDSWGMGDLADLKAMREWSQRLGAGFLLVNPLHAVAPTLPQEASPYLPSSRRFRNPIYLRVEDVPGASDAATSQPELTQLMEQGRALVDATRVDRDATWELKRKSLELIFGADAQREGFGSWRQAQGAALQEFATWCALSDEYGPDWRTWPEPLRQPSGEAVTTYAEEHEDTVTFHAWLQWLLDQQLNSASGDLTVIQDLPIGVAGGGADAWAWQEQLATGVEVGAPPDLHNTAGQNWGSPPFIPWRLRAAGYQPFIESIRATMSQAGGLRVDHVMGLFRLWWTPPGESPAKGAYIRYPGEDLLDIVALESHRARAIVVGEDLGTVEPGVREALAEHLMLSYRLLYFEDADPAEWPNLAMAAITTHDLPTVAGLWSGRDVEDQRRYTSTSDADLTWQRQELLSHLTEGSDLNAQASVEEVITVAHARLGRCPAVLVSAALDDALAVELRPNMPGAPDRDNWSLPLPIRLEEMADHATLLSVVDKLQKATKSDL